MSKVTLSVLLSLSLVLSQFFSYPVLADQYSIEGNGEGSSNQVNIKQEENKTVSQSNEAEIKNEVGSEAITGNNETSGNNGESDVETGDAVNETTVVNSGNINNAEVGCCSEGNSVRVTGNGQGSNNQITSNTTSNTTVSQNNAAKITNNISVYANTGDNEASNNNGDITIKTGDVAIKTGVYNYGNNSYAKVAAGTPGFELKIAGNGEGSTNNIENEFAVDQLIYVNNILDLKNNVNHYANTGGNKAHKNLGDVKIITGDVYLDIILSNKFNNSVVIADCGCNNQPSPTPKPSETPKPTTPPSGGENGGGSGGSGGTGGSGGSDSASGGQGGGQVLGVTLPATGGFSLISASLFAFSLLLSGIMLKLDLKRKRKYVTKIPRDIIFDYIYEYKEVAGQFFNFKLPLPVPRYLYTYC